MVKTLYINLAVQDAKSSASFYNKLGWPTKDQFTSENTSNAVISDQITLMLLEEPKFKEFINTGIAKPSEYAEVINAVQVDHESEIDRIVDAAIQAGGLEYREPQDFGFMKGRAFSDLDGHHWEVMWIKPNQ